MRPFPGEGPSQRAHASDDISESPAVFQPTFLFIGNESAVDAALDQSHQNCNPARDARKERGADTVESVPASPTSKHAAAHDRDSSASAASGSSEPDDHPDDISLTSNPPLHKANLAMVSDDNSQPVTPLMLAMQGPASAVSGISSRRNSVTASLSEGNASQALSVSQELEPDQSAMLDSGSAPQLVMPSIKMPSRRPFTDEGRRLGRLKILVAGDSGIGKTALIKSIVQICDAIVHVDPIAPQATPLLQRSRGRPKSSKNSNSTNQITEIFASTKPYPEWWSDLDDSRLLKRRKSLGGDTILDRNICFIDTPGYSEGSSSMDSITPVIRYIESHYEKMQSNGATDSDMLNMLGGHGGGNQVDVVLYLVGNRLKPVDVKYLQLLTPLTNVIPLLAHADTMTAEAIKQRKARIRSELVEADIRSFSFTISSTGADLYLESRPPYAVSTMTGDDREIMDASLLMSPDYVQPLVPSELTTVVDHIFCENGASWLRHAAAKKYLQWKNSETPSRPRALYRPLTFHGGQSSSMVSSGTLTSPMGAASSYSLARIADHTQREERLAQVRLANWASELQKSLANERAHYETLARGERAIWLTEKLNECVQDGTLVAVGDRDRSASRLREKIRRKLERERGKGTSTMQHQDPLGLLEVTAKVKAHGWVAIEVLGGLGILGGMMIWVSKHGWYSHVFGWAVEQWSEIWHSGEK